MTLSGWHHRGMTERMLPPYVAPSQLVPDLRAHGHGVISPAGLREWIAADAAELQALEASWDALPPDGYLRDGGRYRRRRHSCFEIGRAHV